MENIIKSAVYDYGNLRQATDRVTEEYGFLKPRIIGKSCGGRDIVALKLGSAEEYSLIAAAFHGSEHITSVVLLMLAEELCAALKSGGSLAGIRPQACMRDRGVIFIPRVNPDGCEISIHGAAACGSRANTIRLLCRDEFEHWNANLRGVDINHNFNADWENLRKRETKAGISGPSPTRFGGYSPESEPETKALTELCRSVKIRQAVALHSQGEVIYGGFGGITPPRSEKMGEIMSTSSGYALSSPEGLALGGGFKDWFITEFNRPAFTVELGRGKNPLPPTAAAEIYERVKEMLMLSIIM